MVSAKRAQHAPTRVIQLFTSFGVTGAYSQAEEHVLQPVQKAHEIQGDSIQEGQGLQAGPGR